MSGKLDVMAFSSDWGHLKPFTRELTTAVMPTGSVMGALVSWTLVEMAQPRLVTAYATLAWVLGSLIQLVAPSIEVVRSGRLICGIGAGIVSAVVPPYLVSRFGTHARLVSDVEVIWLLSCWDRLRLRDGRVEACLPGTHAHASTLLVVVALDEMLTQRAYLLWQYPLYGYCHGLLMTNSRPVGFGGHFGRHW